MTEPSEITKKVNDKELDESELHKRMDADFDLWNLKKTVYDNHKTSINITSNDPITFSDDFQSKLSRAERQIRIIMAETEGDDKREDIGKLERLLVFAFEKADERLRRMLLPPLRDSEIWYSLIRGWAVGKFLVYMDGKNVIFDFMAWDRRWVTCEVGSDGLLWVNNKTFRSADSIKDEYGSDIVKGNKNKDIAVNDHWKYLSPEEKENSVECNGEFLKSPTKHKLKSIPVLIMPIATRPPITTNEGDASSGYGESIYAANRGMYPIRNEFASVVASHAKLLAKQPMVNLYDEQGRELLETAYFSDAVLNLPKGHNELFPVPMKEISPTVTNMLNWLGNQVESGSLPDISVGTPPPSGTLYNLIQEQSNKVFSPQLSLLDNFYADACYLIEEQLLTNKIKVDVKVEQKRKYYETQVKPVDLKRPHIIKVEFTATTPWSRLETAQIADMVRKSGVPEGWIWENIYKFPDPKGMQDLAAIELFRQSPKGAMLTAIEALLNTKDPKNAEEAASLIRDMYNMEMQENAQLQGMETTGMGSTPTGAIPLSETETPVGGISPPITA